MNSEKFILIAAWCGRFGNRLHQYAYAATYAEVHNIDFIMPFNWEGTKLFKNQYHKLSDDEHLRKFLRKGRAAKDRIIDEDLKGFFPNIQRINPHEDGYKSFDCPVFFIDQAAYTNKVYECMSRDSLLDMFEFSDEVKETEAYKYWHSRKGEYDIAHLRRDDISNPNFNRNNEQHYSVVSRDSYLKAFEKYGFDPDEMIWVSDDIEKKWHSGRQSNKLFGNRYPEGSLHKKGYVFDWLHDFLALYFARTVFRANSSFSWWAAYLSKTAKVYCPILSRRHIYGVDGMDEIDVEFIASAHTHWIKDSCHILIKEL